MMKERQGDKEQDIRGNGSNKHRIEINQSGLSFLGDNGRHYEGFEEWRNVKLTMSILADLAA